MWAKKFIESYEEDEKRERECRPLLQPNLLTNLFAILWKAIFSRCRLMDFCITFDNTMSGWSIVYIKESQVIISKNNSIVFLSLEIEFVLANSVDPDEMPRFVAFHLGLHSI